LVGFLKNTINKGGRSFTYYRLIGIIILLAYTKGKFGSLGSKIGELSHPHYIAVTSTNKVVVSDTNNSRIQIFDVNGKVLTCFGSEGSEEGLLKSPRYAFSFLKRKKVLLFRIRGNRYTLLLVRLGNTI
jgi:DNA-binding beta-propeller fold protein YncE